MVEDNSVALEVHPFYFPLDVLGHISPESSLEKHLALGLRPDYRALDEFRDVTINDSALSLPTGEASGNIVLGSNILKSGNAIVTTTITGAILEENILQEGIDDTSIEHYAPVYPIVEIEGGRKAGGPTQEEITTSRRLHDCLLHSRLLPKASLRINCGLRIMASDGNLEIVYPDEVDPTAEEALNFVEKRSWKYVLYAKIVVFGLTGSPFDLCWNSLIYALQNTTLPRAFIDERAASLKMTIRTRGRSATVKEAYDLLSDPKRSSPLQLDKASLAFASGYNIFQGNAGEDINGDNSINTDREPASVLVADIDTDIEAKCSGPSIGIVSDTKGRLKNVNVTGGIPAVTPSMIKQALQLSKRRSSHLSSKIGQFI